MKGINLIPAARRTRHARKGRARVWAIAAPACAVLLALGYGYVALRWETRTDDLVSKQELLSTEIEGSKKEINRTKAAAERAVAAAWANKAVADQPDWGLLLALLADKIGDETVLSGVDLRPVDLRPAAGPVSASPAKPGVRPERYTLQVLGYSRKQEAVSQFVLNLEGLGLFESVVMKEARRTTMLSADAIEFRVECTVTDPAGVEQ